MRAIEKENKRLKDILPKNYARSELDKHRLGYVGIEEQEEDSEPFEEK